LDELLRSLKVYEMYPYRLLLQPQNVVNLVALNAKPIHEVLKGPRRVEAAPYHLAIARTT
jgi:hypothetical protein